MKSLLTTLMFCCICMSSTGEAISGTVPPAEKSVSELSVIAKDNIGDEEQGCAISTSNKSSAPLPNSRGQDKKMPGLFDRRNFHDQPAAKILQGGDDISDAVIITAIPFIDSGTTEGYTNDYW